jgi:hypothetical protein
MRSITGIVVALASIAWAGRPALAQDVMPLDRPPQVGVPAPAPPYVEGQAIPRGYHVEEHGHHGVVVTGAVLLGLSYGFTAAVGLAGDVISGAFGGRGNEGDVLLIPIVGPFAMMAEEHEVNGALMLSGLTQLGGVALIGAGATTSKVLARDSFAIRMAAPLPAQGGGGLVLGGTF